jgi:hypothetical protein
MTTTTTQTPKFVPDNAAVGATAATKEEEEDAEEEVELFKNDKQ